MKTITLSEEKLNKVLTDVETLIEDVADLLDQDAIAKQRIKDIEADPSKGKSEEELDTYLKERGVKKTYNRTTFQCASSSSNELCK